MMAKLVTRMLHPPEGGLPQPTLLNIFQDVDFHDKNFTVEQVL